MFFFTELGSNDVQENTDDGINSDVAMNSLKFYILDLLKSRQQTDEAAEAVPSSPRYLEPVKRGPGGCINSCLGGGMSFVRCKSMCHW